MRALLCLAALWGPALGGPPRPTGWLPLEVPNPMRSYPECGTTGPGRVCDPDGVLSEAQRAELGVLVAQLEVGTKARRRGGLSRCQRVGVQAFVAVVRQLHSDSHARASQDEARAFADGLRESWGLDEKYCLKYVLVAISTRDARIQLSVGPRTFLTKGDVGNLLRANIDAFKRGELVSVVGNVLAQAGLWYEERKLGVSIPVYDDAEAEAGPVDMERPSRRVKDTNEAVAQPNSGELPWWAYLVVVMVLVPAMGLLLACCLASSLRSRFCPCVAEEEVAVIQVNGQPAFVDTTWAGYSVGGGELRSKSPSIVHSIHGFPLHRSVSGQGLGSRAPSLLLPPGYHSQRLSRKGSAATSVAEDQDLDKHLSRRSSKRRSHRSTSALPYQPEKRKDPQP